MVNGDVAVLPKERRPAPGDCPQPPEPPIDKMRREDGPMGMVVKVDADIDP